MTTGWGGAWDGGGGGGAAGASGGQGGMYDWVRYKLQKTYAQLPDTDEGLVRETGAVVRALQSRYPCLQNNAALLNDRDRTKFDQAAGLLAAARLRPVLAAGENEGKGMVRREQIGANATEYRDAAEISGGAAKPLEAQWADEAEAVLRTISCIAGAARRQARDVTLFGVSGGAQRQQQHPIRDGC